MKNRVMARFCMAVWMIGLATAGAQEGPVSLRTVWSQDSVRVGDTAVLAVVFEVREPYHINADEAQMMMQGLKPTDVAVVSVSQSAVLKMAPIQWPGAHVIEVDFSPDPVAVFDGQVVVYVPMVVGDHAQPGEVKVELSVTWQACDPQICLLPQNQNLTATLSILPRDQSPGATNEPGIFANFDAGAISQLREAEVPTDVVTFNPFGYAFTINASTTWGWLGLLGVAAFGGLLLNLTPCVLPVIPIKIMGLSRAAGHRGKCLLLGFTMSLGVVAFWLALALAIASLTQFKAINDLFQETGFTLGIGVVIAVMAVGMCGLFSIQLPRFVYQFSPKHDTVVGSFGFGIMTGVLATPCTAPLMGSAAAWAVQRSPLTTLATFGAIGAGMAMPYLILSAWPKLVEKMPRVGPASELVKQVMGLLMLAAAAYFIGVGISSLLNIPPAPPSLVYWWTVAAGIMSAGGWLIWRTWKITPNAIPRVVWTLVGTVTIVGGAYGGASLTDRGPIDWVYYTPQRFDQALAEGEVVVLDFTAEWCLNCKIIEHSVLYSDRVASILSEPGVTPMKVDITSKANVDGTAKLSEVGEVAIPLLVIYAPTGEIILQSHSYTPDLVVEAVRAGKRLRGE